MTDSVDLEQLHANFAELEREDPDAAARVRLVIEQMLAKAPITCPLCGVTSPYGEHWEHRC